MLPRTDAAITALRKALNESGFKGETGGPDFGDPGVRKPSLSLIDALTSEARNQGIGEADIDRAVTQAFRKIIAALADQIRAESGSPGVTDMRKRALDPGVNVVNEQHREALIIAKQAGVSRDIEANITRALNKEHHGTPITKYMNTPVETWEQAWAKYEAVGRSPATPLKKHIDGLDAPANKTPQSRREAHEWLAKARQHGVNEANK